MGRGDSQQQEVTRGPQETQECEMHSLRFTSGGPLGECPQACHPALVSPRAPVLSPRTLLTPWDLLSPMKVCHSLDSPSLATEPSFPVSTDVPHCRVTGKSLCSIQTGSPPPRAITFDNEEQKDEVLDSTHFVLAIVLNPFCKSNSC